MQYVKRLDEMTKEEYQETGGKAANLGEMIRAGFNVPGGFCVTGKSLDYLLEAGQIMPKIISIVEAMNFDDYNNIETKSAEIRQMPHIYTAVQKTYLFDHQKQQIVEVIQTAGPVEQGTHGCFECLHQWRSIPAPAEPALSQPSNVIDFTSYKTIKQ